jgi:hypothetical protein
MTLESILVVILVVVLILTIMGAIPLKPPANQILYVVVGILLLLWVLRRFAIV